MPSGLTDWFSIRFVIIFLLNSAASDYIDFSSSNKYCYSCMPEAFQKHWLHLSQVYYRPVNFTDYCYNMPPDVHIGITPCSHSICITIIEPRILAGYHIGNYVVRGCFSTVFKLMQNLVEHTTPTIDTACKRVPASQLLPIKFAERSSNRTVELCWCIGQLCNDYPTTYSKISALHHISSFLLLCLSVFYNL